jgi:hypothetical protein
MVTQSHHWILWHTFRQIYQPRGLVVRVSDCWLWGPGFDSRVCHGDFSLKGKIPLATMVWIRSLVEFRFKAPPGTSYSYITSTSSGQRNCASWASQPQKSVTFRPQPGRETTKSIRDIWWHWKKDWFKMSFILALDLEANKANSKLRELKWCISVYNLSRSFREDHSLLHFDFDTK